MSVDLSSPTDSHRGICTTLPLAVDLKRLEAAQYLSRKQAGIRQWLNYAYMRRAARTLSQGPRNRMRLKGRTA